MFFHLFYRILFFTCAKFRLTNFSSGKKELPYLFEKKYCSYVANFLIRLSEQNFFRVPLKQNCSHLGARYQF